MNIIEQILDRQPRKPQKTIGKAFAPSNIALCKYWGKRNTNINLPMTDSLSISLGDKGTTTTITLNDADEDQIILNKKPVDMTSLFAKRLVDFLDMFRYENLNFTVDTKTNLPVAAGLASSASGLAAVVLALNDLYQWHLTKRELSILARLGSGSACRSVYHGFVEWHKGKREDGMDSFAERIDTTWPELRIGLLLVTDAKKPISSREAMLRTVATSPSYAKWPSLVEHDMLILKKAIAEKNFQSLGQTAEENAIAMHQTMHDATPPLNYDLEQTKQLKHAIQKLRYDGLPLYFTQDAGPNLKLLFEEKDALLVKAAFPDVEIIKPFE